MEFEINERNETVFVVLSCFVFLMAQADFVNAQEAEGEEGDVAGEESSFPEEVAQFHRTFIEHYMENQERISDLQTIRSAGEQERDRELEETIRDRTRSTLSELRNALQGAREKGTSSRLLNSMKKMMEVYQLYIKKVLTNWEPTDEQVLKRRRMSDREVVEQQPKLAGASLLRRVFLGELLTTALTVPEMGDWFRERISNVRSWIREKYNEMFPLFTRLVSRIERVMNSEEAGEEKRQQVLQEVRSEWNQFWRDIGEGTKWQKMRQTVNRLRSLFRNRSDRLPGGQDQMKQEVSRLQKKIGDLQQLQTSKPFSTQANRLKTMLQLSKTFVKRANELGNSNQSKAISTIPLMFLRDHMDQPPEQVWATQDLESLKKEKEKKIEKIKNDLIGLRRGNYKEERERYNFPIDAVQEIVRRLGINYGKQEKTVARAVREMSFYVQAKYRLSTDGVQLMKTYQRALQNINVEQPDQILQFERSFREEYQTEIQDLMREVNRIREMRDRVDDLVESVRGVDSEELVSAYRKQNNQQK